MQGGTGNTAPGKENGKTMTQKVNLLEVRDEHGDGYTLLQLEDVFMPKLLLENLFGESLEKKLKQLETLQYKDGDVMICSYPKSGTHWMYNLVFFLMGRDEGTIDSISSVSPVWLDGFKEETWISLPSPRVLSCHLKANRLPPALKENAKLVYIIRNPKDVCVSLHHFYSWSGLESQQTWDSTLKHFLQGPTMFDLYTDYLQRLEQEILANPAFKPCILFFEDLKTDGVNELRKLQEYLGLHHSDAHLQAVLDRCGVSKLRRDVEQGKVDTTLIDNNKSVLYRKGEIGDWKNLFSVAQNESFDRAWSEKMGDSMFKFRYE